MPRVTIPGIGDVNFPDNMPRDEIMRRAEKMQLETQGPKYDARDLPTGELLKGGFSRGIEGLKGTALDLIPALGASLFGSKDYAKEQLEEYRQRMAAEEAINPTAYRSISNVQGPGDIIPFAAETIGELGPDILSFIGGAGIGSQVAKQAAKKGVASAIEKQAAEMVAKRGLTGTAAEEATKKLSDRAIAQGVLDNAISQGAANGAKWGLTTSSMATNIPDTFQSVYEETGELAPLTSTVIGGLVGLLDTALPNSVLKKLGPEGKKLVAAQLVDRSTVVPTTWKKAFATELLKDAGTEFGTEGLQQILQIGASQIQGSKQAFFSPENVDSIITAAVKGLVGGSVMGTPTAISTANQQVRAAKQQVEINKTKQEQQESQQQAAQQQTTGNLFGEEQGPATPYDARQAQEDLAARTAPPQAQPPAQQQMGLDLQGGMTAEQMQTQKRDEQNQAMNQLYMEEAAKQAEAAKQRVEQARLKFESDIAETDARVASGEISRREAARLDLLHPILENTDIKDTAGAFKGNLKRAGYANLELTDTEKQLIQRADDVKAALADSETVKAEPATPSQLSPAITGIKEKGEKGPAGTPKAKEPTQMAIPGIGKPQIAEAPVEAPAPETPAGKTLLDADTLKNTGLKTSSGVYKRLLGRDMSLPEDQQAVAQVLSDVRNNPSLAPSTKQAIESVAMQAFNALATQQEMFGPRGGVLKGAESGRISPRPVSEPTGGSVPVSVGQESQVPAARTKAPKKGGVERPATTTAGPRVGEEVKHDTLNETAKDLRAGIKFLREAYAGTQDPEAKREIAAEVRALEARLEEVSKPKKLEEADKLAKPLSAEIVSALKQGDIKTALALLAKETDGFASDVAQKLSTTLEGTKVEVVNNLKDEAGNRVPGLYDPVTDTILLDSKIGLVDHVLLHEPVHAATSHVLDNPSHPVTRQLQALLDKIKDSLSTAYGTKDVHEFAAEAKSNKAFRDELQTIFPDGGKHSAWDKFVNIIGNFLRRMVGMPTKPLATALDNVDQLVDSILSPAPESRDGGKLFAQATAKKNDEIFTGMDKIIRDLPVFNDGQKARISNALNAPWQTARSAVFGILPTHAFGEVAEEVLPGMGKRFNTLINERSGYENKLVKGSEAVFTQAQQAIKASPKQQDAFNSIVNESTKAEVDPTQPRDKYKNDPEKLKDWDDLHSRYVKLDKVWQDLYKSMRDAYKGMYNQVLEAINVRIDATGLGDNQKLLLKQDIMAKLAKRGILEPYFALGREGEYWLAYDYKDKDGQSQRAVQAFKTDFERKTRMQELADAGVSSQPYANISEVNYRNAPSGSFVNSVLKSLEVNGVDPQVTDEVMRLFLSTLPETAFAQSFQKRKGTAGENSDTIGTFEKKMRSTAHQVSNMRYGAQLTNLVGKMSEYAKSVGAGVAPELDAKGNPIIGADGKPKLQPQRDNSVEKEYVSEFEKRLRYVLNPSKHDVGNLLTSVAFNYTLGFNVSSAVVNMANVPMVVAPYLAGKYQGSNVKGALSDAYKLFTGSGFKAEVEALGADGRRVKQKVMPSILNYGPDTPEGKRYATLVRIAEEQGQLNRSQLYELLQADTRTGLMAKVNAASGWLFHHGERMNREVTMIATYNLELERLKKEGKTGAEAEVEAANHAIYATELTNGGISAASAPRLAQSALGKVLFMYKRYGVSMYYAMFRMAREGLKSQDPEVRKAAMKQIGGIFGMSALFAGAQGIPLFGVAAMIYNAFADDDEPDFETVTRQYMGELPYKGLLNYYLNLEVASRIGLSDLVIRESKMAGSQTFASTLGQMIGGPVLGVGERLQRGFSKIAEGHTMRGIEDLLPTAPANVLKSIRYATEGAKTLRGDPIIDEVSAWNVGAQALGFAPADYTRQLEINSRLKGIDKKVNTDATKFKRQYFIASRMGDTEGMAEAKQNLLELGEKHKGLGINSSTVSDILERSMTAQKRTTKEMKHGVRYSPRMAKELETESKLYD